jgi:predicted DCC family thiol-disulfide oxidoreductase YuxK
MPSKHFPILFFDGCCPLCNFVVRIIYRIDTSGIIRFAPIESELGRAVIERYPELKNIDSAFILDNDEKGNERIAWKSKMLARVSAYIRWPWKFMFIPFKIIPHAIGDWMYEFIAQNRNKIFRRYDACPIPPTGLRERFLTEG